jgi:hypothetical protein
MKNSLLLISAFCIFFSLSGQIADNFSSKNWVKMLEESANDAVILFGKGTGDLNMKLTFSKKDTVTIYGNPGKGFEFQYKVTDSVISMTNFGDYKINFLNDTLLDMVTYSATPNDYGSNLHMVFLEENYLLGRLLKTGEISTLNDSTILANKIIYPTFSSTDFMFFLNWYIPEYKQEKENGILTFSMIFNPEGKLILCDLIGNENISKGFASKMTAFIYKITNLWNVPKSGKRYYFDLVMCVLFPTKQESMLQLAYPFFFSKNCRPLPKGNANMIDEYSENGYSHLDKLEYAEAIEDFNTALSYDSTGQNDIYYTRAYTYYKLNKMQEACSDWSILRSRGEKYAMKLYSKYCDLR